MSSVSASVTSDIEAAARFGGHGTGVTRLAWSPELRQVLDWLTEQLVELGLEVEIDAAGNLIGRWEAGSGKPIAVGSHLDTVPSGGRYDGALGVLSGLQAIRLLKERGVEPRRPVWLISFMDEEGARFGAALFGSRAFVGTDLRELAERRDADGVGLPEAMSEFGFDFERISSAGRVDELGGYIELHIEQGPVLETENIEIGIVTGIVGLIGFRVRLTGEANHAGTTPMSLRRDALCGAATAILALRDAGRARDDITTNVGIISAEPGGFNVVPGASEFTIDVRSATEDGYATLEPLVRDTLGRIAEEQGLELEISEAYRLDPLPLAPELVDVLEQAAAAEGATSRRMPSGAGHDAMEVGRHVPAGMLFVPSRKGISHSPEEFTEPEHCELGARVLARALETLLAD
jgi:hydantoinase/carbamoylase family amidase